MVNVNVCDAAVASTAGTGTARAVPRGRRENAVIGCLVAVLCLSGCLRFSAKPRGNNKPVASVVTANVIATPGETIVLDGTPSSDADSDTLSFRWDVVASTDALLIPDPEARTTTLTLPDRGQRIYVRLLVNDGAASSEPALVAVRVNTPPRADAGQSRTGASPLFIDGAATDAEGDAITQWEWRVVAAPTAGQPCVQDVAACLSDADKRTARFEPPEPGVYKLSLRASDDLGFGAVVEVSVTVLEGNHAPVLALSHTTEVATEGTSFVANAIASDLDGDALVITWTKQIGPSAFPETLVGATPALVAPGFIGLLGNNNFATYEVVASDGQAESTAATVTLVTAPGAGYVIVSSAAAAFDAPTCGTRTVPCRSIGYALSVLDPDDNGVGDGRQLVVTTGLFTDQPPFTGLAWKAGVSLYGGRDPVTFIEGAPSQWQINGNDIAAGCAADRTAVVFGNNVVGAEFHRVAITHTTGSNTVCDHAHRTVQCNSCTVSFSDSDIRSTGEWGAAATAIQATTGTITLQRTFVQAANAFNFTRCLNATGASTIHLLDSELETLAQDPHGGGAEMSVIHSTGSNIDVQRSSLRVIGPGYTTIQAGMPTTTVLLDGGTFVATNSDFVQRVSGAFYNVYAFSATPVTLVNTTLVGPAAGVGAGAAVSALSAVGVMNSLITAQRNAFELRNAAAASSQIYGNLLEGVDQAMICSGGSLSTAADLNAPAASMCNTSAQAWSGNLSGVCPVISGATYDFRLETSGSNDCVDAGLASSPVGVAPSTDAGFESRPQGSAPDVGSDEAG